MTNLTRQNLDEILQTASDRLYPAELGEAKVSLNSKSCDGDTPLHVFIWGEETEKALLLIHYGADINAQGDMGETPLHIAIRKNNIKVVSWFSVNWNFSMSELTYSAKGEFNEKETSQLHA